MELTDQNWRDWLVQQKELASDEHWNFDKFKIECSKCQSKNVEMNGYAEAESGYYDSCNLRFDLLVKCHNCGNAMSIKPYGDFSGGKQ